MRNKKILEKYQAIPQRQSRIEILQIIAEKTHLKRIEVEAVFNEMANLIEAHLKKQGSGEIILPKLGIKLRKVRRSATKARKMKSPLTGKEVEIHAKPEREEVKLVALKSLKEKVST